MTATPPLAPVGPVPSPRRIAVFVVVALLCIGAAAAYAWWAGQQRARSGAAPARIERPFTALPGTGPYLLLRVSGVSASQGHLALERLGATDGMREVSAALDCERVHASRASVGRGICLEARRGVLTTYHAHLFDSQLRTIATLDLAGAPSRARMSADGRLAATTVFVAGHSYSAAGFSTRTSIIDVEAGRMRVPDLEVFAVMKDGEPFRAADFNIWGVTFTPDGQGFYATLQTGGKQWLVRGELAAQRMTLLRPGVECPSLSPDGQRIAFKRRVTPAAAGVVWQLVVLDLARDQETVLTSETRTVDDQVEWLDNGEIAYGLPDAALPAATNTWALAIDGRSAPRLLAPLAYSPAVVR
jgi:hypothetical protein